MAPESSAFVAPAPVVLGSGLWLGLAWPRPSPHSLRDARARTAWDARQEPEPPRRSVILVPMREPLAGELPAAAGRLVDVARAAGATVRVTYACAEDGKLVESIAVRVRMPDGTRGWAMWINGYAGEAQWWPATERMPRTVGHREFAALVEGKPFVPPSPRTPAPVGPCPRCGRAVRWKLQPAPAPYAHQRVTVVENSTTRERCE